MQPRSYITQRSTLIATRLIKIGCPGVGLPVWAPTVVAQRRRESLLQQTRQRIRRGVFRSIPDLQAAINAYVPEHNARSNPSAGPNPPRQFWLNSIAALYRLFDRCTTRPSPSILTTPANSAREGGSGTAAITGVVLTGSKFVDVDAIASNSKLIIASTKAVDPVAVDAVASKFKCTINSAKSVDAGDPVDVDALANKFTLTIASAKAIDPVDVVSTVLTAPAVKSSIV